MALSLARPPARSLRLGARLAHDRRPLGLLACRCRRRIPPGVDGSGSVPSAASRRLMSSARERRAQRRVELVDDRRAACRPAPRCRSAAPPRSRAGRLPRPSAGRGRAASASAPVTASARTLPSLHEADRRRQRGEIDRDMAADQIGQRRRRCPCRARGLSLMPAMAANSSAPRWMPLPMPVEAIVELARAPSWRARSARRSSAPARSDCTSTTCALGADQADRREVLARVVADIGDRASD